MTETIDFTPILRQALPDSQYSWLFSTALVQAGLGISASKLTRIRKAAQAKCISGRGNDGITRNYYPLGAVIELTAHVDSDRSRAFRSALLSHHSQTAIAQTRPQPIVHVMPSAPGHQPIAETRPQPIVHVMPQGQGAITQRELSALTLAVRALVALEQNRQAQPIHPADTPAAEPAAPPQVTVNIQNNLKQGRPFRLPSIPVADPLVMFCTLFFTLMSLCLLGYGLGLSAKYQSQPSSWGTIR